MAVQKVALEIIEMQRPPEHVRELFRFPGKRNETEEAQVYGVPNGFPIAAGSRQDAHHLRVDGLGLLQEPDALLPRHVLVSQEDSDLPAVFLQKSDRLPRAGSRQNREILLKRFGKMFE